MSHVVRLRRFMGLLSALVLTLVACVADTDRLDPRVGRDASVDAGPKDHDAGSTKDAGVSRRDRIVRTCVRLASCGLGLTGIERRNASGCLDAFARIPFFTYGTFFGGGIDVELVERALECSDANDCRAYSDCFGGDLLALTSCIEGASCDGDRIVREGTSYDCTRSEGSCLEPPTGAQRACCRPKACDGPDLDPCRDLLFCSDFGGGFHFDCAASGRVCVDEGELGPICRGPGEPCEGDSVGCERQEVSYCVAGSEARADCRKTLFRTGCGESSAGGMPCAPSGDECDPEAFAGSCEGSEILLCADGRIERFDCRKLGFEICMRREGVAFCGFLL
ncbi:MAG: hypothetical protein HYV07_11815 [Deltaproteobacteria bacterium]|nr:hypothetical protein [Deltaproteobacteria bacterium]